MDGERVFVRAFVAVSVGEQIRGELHKAQMRLARAHAQVSWVVPEKIHLTLLFLGSVPRDLVGAVGEAIREAAAGVAPFTMAVAGLGHFGRPHAPRVIWAGVRSEPALMTLQERVAVAIGALSLKVEEREYKPHITLGRVRSPAGAKRLMEMLAETEGVEFGRVEVSEICLMESVLKPQCSEYSVICAVPLGGVLA